MKATRFGGKIKSKSSLGGSAIIDRILEVYYSLFSEVILVTNTPEEFLQYKGCIKTPDILKGFGPVGGIHAAMRKSSLDSVFVIAGDMPFIDKYLVSEMVERYSTMTVDALVPLSDSGRQPLHAVYRNHLAGSIEEYLSGGNDRSVMGFLEIINVADYPVSREQEIEFMNINTPADLSAAREMERAKGRKIN
ncbi:MAG: molybdenum cofactor guanylyltransferase [Bacteroidales bacterium]